MIPPLIKTFLLGRSAHPPPPPQHTHFFSSESLFTISPNIHPAPAESEPTLQTRTPIPNPELPSLPAPPKSPDNACHRGTSTLVEATSGTANI